MLFLFIFYCLWLFGYEVGFKFKNNIKSNNVFKIIGPRNHTNNELYLKLFEFVKKALYIGIGFRQIFYRLSK